MMTVLFKIVRQILQPNVEEKKHIQQNAKCLTMEIHVSVICIYYKKHVMSVAVKKFSKYSSIYNERGHLEKLIFFFPETKK